MFTISVCSMREVLRHCMFNSTGILVSEQQEWFCRERYGNLPFWLILCDDRTEALCEEKPFDRIVSIGMLEHICHKNDQVSFSILSQRIKPHGLAWLGFSLSALTTPIHTWIDRPMSTFFLVVRTVQLWQRVLR